MNPQTEKQTTRAYATARRDPREQPRDPAVVPGFAVMRRSRSEIFGAEAVKRSSASGPGFRPRFDLESGIHDTVAWYVEKSKS